MKLSTPVIKRPLIVPSSHLNKILHRIQTVSAQNLPGLATWEISKKIKLESTNEWLLELERPYIKGACITDLMQHTLNESTRFTLVKHIAALTNEWKRMSFVHGDISPGNFILQSYDEETAIQTPLIGIDWLFDLKSRAGTPYFAAPECAKGIHDADTDDYSTNLLIEFILQWNVHTPSTHLH